MNLAKNLRKYFRADFGAKLIKWVFQLNWLANEDFSN